MAHNRCLELQPQATHAALPRVARNSVAKHISGRCVRWPAKLLVEGNPRLATEQPQPPEKTRGISRRVRHKGWAHGYNHR